MAAFALAQAAAATNIHFRGRLIEPPQNFKRLDSLRTGPTTGERNHAHGQIFAVSVSAVIGAKAAMRPSRARRRLSCLSAVGLSDFPTADDVPEVKLIAGASAKEAGDRCKMVHFMRHSTAVVNEAGRAFPKGDPRKKAVRQDAQYFDSPLSEGGFAQCEQLRAGALEGRSPPPQVELVVVSPLTRALQTASAVFGADEAAPRMYSLEALREFCSKEFQPCDQRRPRDEQEAAFPHVDFRHVPPGQDTLLAPGALEAPEGADARIRWLLAWLAQRPEKEIACVAHFQILSRILAEHLEPAGWDATAYGDMKNLEVRSVPIAFE